MDAVPILRITGDSTFRNVIDIRYDYYKTIAADVWQVDRARWFEDVFHNTILNCLKTLNERRMDEDEIKRYFFKAFRINMVRQYGYAYDKTKSGIDVESVIIPVHNEHLIATRMDGFAMLDLVRRTHGQPVMQLLQDQLNGYTYRELEVMSGEKGVYKLLQTIKAELKRVYLSEGNVWV